MRLWKQMDGEGRALVVMVLALVFALAMFFVADDAVKHAQAAEERSDCVNNAVYYTYYVHGDDASYAQMKANLARCGTGFWQEER